MRCLGQLDSRKSAESLVAYLLTLEITTQIEALDEGRDHWEVWVRDEDKLPAARKILEEFRSNPHDPKYAQAVAAAKRILEEKEQKRRQAAKNIRRLESSSRPALVGRGPLPPLTLTLLIISIAISLVSSFGNPTATNDWGQAIVRELSFVDAADFDRTEDPAASLKKGEVWRTITPIFLHLSMIHLAMNMFVLVSFGRIVERWIGTPRYALFVLLLSIAPNLLQGLSPAWMQGSPFFGGMSGVLYGLLGYVWIRSSINPNHGISIPFPLVILFVGLMVVGLSGLIDNWHLAELCHLGGFLIGCASGFASEQMPGKP